MIFPPHHARPFALPLRLIIGGTAMAVLYVLLQGGTLMDASQMLIGLYPEPTGDPSKDVTLLACGRTLLVISLALITATAAAITLFSLTRHLPTAFGSVPQWLGQLLFATPVFGLLWAWIGWHIGSHGGVIETLLPPRPQGIGEDLLDQSARHLWTWLAPILALATPLTGLLLSRFSADWHPSAYAALTASLRARGLSPARLFDHHLLPLLWPSWLRCLESSLFTVLILDLVVESTLQFPGWGSGFVQALKSTHPSSLAFGLHTAGILAALLCGLLHLFRRRPAPFAPPSPSKPFPMASLPALIVLVLVLVTLAGLVLVATSPVHLQNARLASGVTWLASWANDLVSCLRLIGLAMIGGLALAALRLTVLGDWLRRYGTLESLVWSPLPLWALAWSHTSGQIISIDLALAVMAAVTLSIHLHSSSHRHLSSRLVEASRTLGASSWQAWRQHALRPWSRELCAVLIALVGSAWWLRVFMHSLLPTEKTTPDTSLGSFLAHAATDALHHPLPVLSASLAAGVSILFLWSLGRIIHPHHPDDA